MKILNDFWKSNVLSLFIFIIFINLLFKTSIDYLFVNKSLYYNTFSEQISIERIEQLIEATLSSIWVSYLFSVLLIFLRIIFSGILIYIGVFFAEIKLKFSKVFKTALIAEFVYIISGIIKFTILVLYKNVSTLNDLQYTPLSIMSLFDYDGVDPVLIYPLSLLNIFELMYFLVLASLLVIAIKESKQLQPIKYGQSLKLVVSSYGSGLLIWVLLVMFISLNIT